MKPRLTTLAIVLLLAISAGMAYANTVTVTASPANIPADGNALTELKAVVKDGNNDPVANATVYWTKDPNTPLGTILDATSMTDSSGIAKSRLRAPINTGETTVIATCGTDTNSAVVHFCGPVDGGLILWQMNASLVKGSQTPLHFTTLFFADEAELVGDGTAVSFSASDGTITQVAHTVDGRVSALFTAGSTDPSSTITATCGTKEYKLKVAQTGTATGVRVTPCNEYIHNNGATCIIRAAVVDADGNMLGDGVPIGFSTDKGTITASGMTCGGFAEAILTSSDSIEEATVTATYGQLSGEATVTFVGDPATVAVSFEHQSIPADGASSTAIIAIVTDEEGNPAADGTKVSFSKTAGDISQFAFTKNGTAIAYLQSESSAGQSDVTAQAGSESGLCTVYFAGEPASVHVWTDIRAISPDGVSTCTISGRVEDSLGNAVPDGTQVDLSTNGRGSVPVLVTTSCGGFSATLCSDTTAGTSTVTAECGSASESVNVVFGEAPATIQVQVLPNSIPVGGSYALVEATVTDQNGRIVPDGTVIAFTTTYGTLSGSSSTTLDGKASVRLSAASSGSGTVTAANGSVQGTAAVEGS